ncbi:MAG TPA: hypothetical protein VES42_20525 [Pilimelia sp.]|nr:hypothetical protein [Pilimelia sp.]
MRAKPFILGLAVLAAVVGFAPGAAAASATAPTPVPPHRGLGHLDFVTQHGLGVRVAGWIIDPSTSQPVIAHIWSDGAAAGSGQAAVSRPDVGQAYPSYGPNHGFDFSVRVTPGLHTICLYLNQAGPVAGQPPIDCKSVTVRHEPFGAFDGTQPTGSGVLVSGWAIDPDTAAAIDVHVYIDGVIAGGIVASAFRPDVANVYPAYGTHHGFVHTFPASPGSHEVCIYAINAGAGAGNPLLGCKRT